MAGGSIEIGKCQRWGERASARRSTALSETKSDPGTDAGVIRFLWLLYLCELKLNYSAKINITGHTQI